MALAAMMVSAGASNERVSSLQWYRAQPQGTNLAELSRLANEKQVTHRLIHRKPGAAVPIPSIVHWKVGHFAAIIGEANGRYRVRDAVFPGRDIWVTPTALDEEASGYFLTGQNPASDWLDVTVAEAQTIWGKGPTNGTPPGTPGEQDPPADDNPPPDCGGMCRYSIGDSTVSVGLSDKPVGYAPPIGPATYAKLTYVQREDSQPANFTFSNIGRKWSLNWITYVTDDPTNPGASVSRNLPAGGAYHYSGYDASSGLFSAQSNDGSVLVLVSTAPGVYRRNLPDGSVEIYAQSDGAISYPRRIFLSQVNDPQGNALTLSYDSRGRLTTLTDATGRQTTFSYHPTAFPFAIRAITDPFGRSATLAYDGAGRLSSITDVIGMTSSFGYDANSLVNALTTPYGTTTFAFTAPGSAGPPRFVEVTDPLGYHERVEWIEPAPIPASEPTTMVPVGMPLTPTNQYLQYRNSFYWDKQAYVKAGCTSSGGCDYTKARIRHYLHASGMSGVKSTSIESVKYPLENRIWFQVPGQTDSVFDGSYTKPIATARVLDDGSTQISRTAYDTSGYFNVTQITDPFGRTTTFSYSNKVDVGSISQTTLYGERSTVAQFVYNTKHRPILYTDAAGQTATFAYNAAGQLTTATNPRGETITYQYGASANLASVTNANNATDTTFTYDAFNRVRTRTDSEGWAVTYDYDALDRIIAATYPDGTIETYSYDKLDLVAYKDRQGNTWSYTWDANRRLVSVLDPIRGLTAFGYTPTGKLASLTDPKSNTTTWTYNIQSRPTLMTYPDSSTVTYTYEAATSRLASTTDALGQVKQYSYAKDDRLAGITYQTAVNPTPSVSYTYDRFFPRRTSMSDGQGTTTFSYNPIGSLGALRSQQETGPLGPIAYTYDELGRLTSRTVGAAGPETYAYDRLGRLTGHGHDLGQFTLSYLGQTSQMTQRQLSSSSVSTSWGYLPNGGDRRLASITNTGIVSGQQSVFQFTTTPENLITGIEESGDAAPVYPPIGSQNASFNSLNQITSLAGQNYSWNAVGNLLSDGQRTYSWDAENRLVGIAYPASPGKATSFAYDGQSRRVAITETPAGGAGVATSYVWCGDRICQALDATGVATRAYYAEGEFLPGTTP